jgi:hypothetical protein
MAEQLKPFDWWLAFGGAIAGALVGYLGFLALMELHVGLYPLVLPGALLGIGAGGLSGHKSNALAVVCGLAGAAAGMLVDWHWAPFIKDPSFNFYLAHLSDVHRAGQFSIVAGAVFAAWFGRGREGGVWPRRTAPVVVPTGRNMSEIRATANAHIKRDMEAGRKWVCQCSNCHEIRSLIGVDKTLEVRPLVRKIVKLEEQLESMPAGPDMQLVLDEYLKAYDELAEVMAK